MNKMIRKLVETDCKKLMDYLKQEPEINLFIIGDIENYGFSEPFQDLWGDFNRNGEYEAVLLKFRSHFILYTHKPHDYDYTDFSISLKQYIENRDVGEISGKSGVIDGLYPLIKPQGREYKRKRSYFVKCEKINPDFPINHLDKVEYAKNDKDLIDIAYLLDNRIEEFEGSRDINAMKSDFQKGLLKISIIRDQETGKLASTATTTAESQDSAMVIAVATDPAYRKRGYASACMYKLTKDLIDRGKTACLFYYNPQAGNIYKKLGYEEIGMWDMVILR
jgi:hypothetical protein